VEEDAVNGVVMQHDMSFKQNAAAAFSAISATANQLLPKARAQEPLPTDLLISLNTAVSATESRYNMARSDTIPMNLMNSQPGSKLYPGLLKKVETLCSRTMQELEQRERDAFKNQLLRGGQNPALDAQRADLEARLKQSKDGFVQKYAQILSQSDHLPVYKEVPAGAQNLKIMTWNVMEFPKAGQALIMDGLIPMIDLIVKQLSRGKEERQVLMDALVSEVIIGQHCVQMLNMVSDAFETRGMDAVVLQEIGTDTQAQLTQLCIQKGWQVCFSTGNADPMKLDAITGIVSKKPFDEQTQIEVVENKKSRNFAAVRIGTAWLVSCHIPLGNQATEEQKQDVGARMAQEISQRCVRHGSGLMLICAGDWNADVNGVKNRLSLNLPYGCSQVAVYTDAKTAFGAAFPVDGVICLQ
jgi:exonuclease III